jgi:hypothetical protein
MRVYRPARAIPPADEKDLPALEPLGGCRPLDTYTGSPLASGRNDCPCGGAVAEGDPFVCLVCHRTRPGFDAELRAMRARAIMLINAALRPTPRSRLAGGAP